MNEPGFYRLVFLSRSPEAEKVKAWVFREVLPSIRKHGYYRAGREDVPTELKALPPGRRDFVILWLDICNEIAAAPRRLAKIEELAERYASKRGFKKTNILRRFYAWCHSNGDWRVLDRWSNLYKYAEIVPLPGKPAPPLIIQS